MGAEAIQEILIKEKSSDKFKQLLMLTIWEQDIIFLRILSSDTQRRDLTEKTIYLLHDLTNMFTMIYDQMKYFHKKNLISDLLHFES